MTVVGGLVIAAAILLLLLAGLVAAVGAMVREAQAARDSFVRQAKTVRGALGARLGRKHLNRRATIPPALEEDVELFPEGDPDQVALQSYDPMPEQVVQPPVRAYSEPAGLALLKSDWSWSGVNSINIASLPDVLSISPSKTYGNVFEFLSKPDVYPVPPPIPPRECRRPPGWNSRATAFAAPTFTPPHYDGVLSRLNPIVDAAYADEWARVARAQRRKAKLEAALHKRDRDVERLAKSAAETWKRASEDQQRAFKSAMAAYQQQASGYMARLRADKSLIQTWHDAIRQPGPAGLLARIELAQRFSFFQLTFIATEGQSRYDEATGVIVHEHRFPDLEKMDWHKAVQTKSDWKRKPVTIKERKEAAAKLWPMLCLRFASQIAVLDTEGLVKGIAING